MLHKIQQHSETEFNDVYIIGAGASVAYGFPTGYELKHEILDLVKRSSGTMFGNILVSFEATSDQKIKSKYPNFQEQFKLMVEELKLSGSLTIDSFVDKNPHFLKQAQVAVGYILKVREKKNKANNHLPDENSEAQKWIHSYLNKRIDKDYAGYIGKPDLFINFNYDLLLESHFFNYYSKQKICTIENLEAFIYSKLPVIHPYGRLGIYELPTTFKTNDLPAFLEACENINFIERDKIKQDSSLIHNILEKAKRIIILGYGFDQTNNDLIFGGKSTLQNKISNAKIIGTAKGLSESEIERFKFLRYPKSYSENISTYSKKEHHPELFRIDCLKLLEDHVLVKKFFSDEDD